MLHLQAATGLATTVHGRLQPGRSQNLISSIGILLSGKAIPHNPSMLTRILLKLSLNLHAILLLLLLIPRSAAVITVLVLSVVAQSPAASALPAAASHTLQPNCSKKITF